MLQNYSTSQHEEIVVIRTKNLSKLPQKIMNLPFWKNLSMSFHSCGSLEPGISTWWKCLSSFAIAAANFGTLISAKSKQTSIQMRTMRPISEGIEAWLSEDKWVFMSSIHTSERYIYLYIIHHKERDTAHHTMSINCQMMHRYLDGSMFAH